MRIIYTLYIGRPNTDVSYNAAWQGFGAYAEISLGLIVTCTLTLLYFAQISQSQRQAAPCRHFEYFRPFRIFGSFDSIHLMYEQRCGDT